MIVVMVSFIHSSISGCAGSSLLYSLQQIGAALFVVHGLLIAVLSLVEHRL